ncbi:hypothetical protein [Carboxylicivirga sp. N1Y90]|uniref:hypothetical protein n=1 Tax=Carboxylicivirga fragile TaxID=3417571 RepID=UPI003D33A4F3|nr:hypothetical protein [Marinilabiliaceae bacterium N1Y90]
MMKQEPFEDDKLRRMMEQSKVEMPFSDFESRLMSRIASESSWKKSVGKNMRLSWLFFTIGSLFGILATILLPLIKRNFFGLDIQLIQIPILLVITFVFIWQLDAMIKQSAQSRTKRVK